MVDVRIQFSVLWAIRQGPQSPAGCQMEAAFSASVLARGHLQFLATWAFLTWLLASSKPARESPRKMGMSVWYNVIIKVAFCCHFQCILLVRIKSQVRTKCSGRRLSKGIRTGRWGLPGATLVSAWHSLYEVDGASRVEIWSARAAKALKLDLARWGLRTVKGQVREGDGRRVWRGSKKEANHVGLVGQSEFLEFYSGCDQEPVEGSRHWNVKIDWLIKILKNLW